LSVPAPEEVERKALEAHGSALSARLYDPFLWWGERSGLSRAREKLLSEVSGEVLEIGAGTGLNLSHYPAGLERLVLTEPEEHKAAMLLHRAHGLGHAAEFVRASAEALPFEDDSFDTVVATLVFCTVGDPVAALDEARRVLRSGGRLLFIEHIRSDSPRTGAIQDRLEGPWKRLADGCHCNRRTLALMDQAGWEVTVTRRTEKWFMPPVARPIVIGQAI
jgi:SAM-dependent methyltransferase